MSKPDQNVAASADATQILISGTTRHKATGQPISGIELKWVASLKGALVGKERTVLLGETVSAAHGRFSLAIRDDAEALAAFRYLGASSESASAIKVAGISLAAVDVPVSPRGGNGIGVLVDTKPEVKPASKGDVKALAEFLEVNRLVTAADLRGQLAAPWADSPAAAWPADQRLMALKEFDIEMKNADKSGRDGGDQLLDFKRMDAGELSGTVTDVPYPGGLTTTVTGKKSNLRLYRDYLRGIWVSAATLMHQTAPFQEVSQPSRSALERQIDNRLHQNFRTPNETQTPTAVLVAALLKEMLVALKDNGGFGKTAAGIPAKAVGQSDDNYLAALIQLTGQTRDELGKRFRVDFAPSVGATTSAIQLNVDALRGLLSDSYQAPLDPYPTLPDINESHGSKPIILSNFAGQAPFYLQYEEWLERQKPFYCENQFDIRRTIPSIPQDYRVAFTAMWGKSDLDATKGKQEFREDAVPTQNADGVGAILTALYGLIDGLNGAVWQIDTQDFGGASSTLDGAASTAFTLLGRLLQKGWYRDEFVFQPLNFTDQETRAISLRDRSNIDTGSIEGLQQLENFFAPPDFPHNATPSNPQYDFAQTMLRNKAFPEGAALSVHWLNYVLQIFIPFLRSRIAQATRNYPEALKQLGYLTGVVVGVAEQETPDTYANMKRYVTSSDSFFRIFREESLPYTATVRYTERTGARENVYPIPSSNPGDDRSSRLRDSLALSPCEWRTFKLAQGRAMLDWAEQLFRTDEPSSIRRARELYKGVLILHGADAGITPRYPKEGDPTLVTMAIFGNPAIRAQVERANYGLFLIREGLNAYGWREDMVPVLRFRPLKDASDALASAAKSAEDDFIACTERFEAAQLDRMYAQLLVEKGKATVGIADEQIAMAEYDVKLAQDQVKEVEKQIEKKQEEIDDHDSLFTQFGDYLSGAKKALEGLTKKDKGGDSTSGAAMKQLAAVGGSGATVLGGMAIFVYVSWVSMEGMEKAANGRADEIKRLRDIALPAAKAQVTVRQREVSIAGYQKRIAEADLQYANALMRFNRDRFLSAETWAKLAGIAEQLMVYYVDNAARMGWLAERALAFEQARAINIIRKNYLPGAMRGLTGPDTLQADLAALENGRLLGIKLTMPVQHTVSLAREFPLAFGALMSTGRCSFATDEATLRERYAGLFGFRIRTVGVKAQTTGADLTRGMLRNRGVSSVGVNGGQSEQVLIRFPDALPISEFSMKDDMDAFGLPGEALLQFEGSGFTTAWEIALFPGTGASPALTDVLITFDGFGFYNDGIFVERGTGTAATANRTILFAGSSLNFDGVAALRDGTATTLALDLSGFASSRGETRSIANLALLLLGEGPDSVVVTAGDSGETADVALTGGIAASNAPPFDSSAGAMPLNAFHGISMDQAFTLDFGSTDLALLNDVAVLIEYTPQTQ